MRISIVIEDIDDTKSTDRKDKPVGRLAFGELVDASIYLVGFTAETNRLPNELPVARECRDSPSPSL